MGSLAFIGSDCLYEANPPGQQFLHHAPLKGAGFVASGFEGGDPGARAREDGGAICSSQPASYNSFDEQVAR